MELVSIDGNAPVTTTLIIAQGVNLEHRAVLQLFKKYEKELTGNLSTLPMRKLKTAGRSTEYAILDEQQTTFLITLMKNSAIVVAFKRRLVAEFFKQRKLLAAMAARQTDQQWRETRKDGMVQYKQKTDVIKQFVDYATAQGSKSASLYFCNLANMENTAMFFIEQKYPNLRNALSMTQLMQLCTADTAIEKALLDGMDQNLNYKDCYKLAKDRVTALAELIGKSPVCDLLSASKTSIKIENKRKK